MEEENKEGLQAQDEEGREGRIMIPEKEREALMQLTMCARDNCDTCRYQTKYTHKDCELEITDNMIIIADALERLAERETDDV